MKKINIFFLIIIMTSCSTSHQVIRETYVRDTIFKLDTLIKIIPDSVKIIYPCRDTVIIKDKERVKLLTQVKDGVIYTICEAKEDEISIKKEKIVQIFKSIYQNEKKQQKGIYWIFIGIIVSLLFVLMILRIFRKLL